MTVVEARSFGGSFMPDGFSPFGLIVFAGGALMLRHYIRPSEPADRSARMLISAIVCMIGGAAAFIVPMLPW